MINRNALLLVLFVSCNSYAQDILVQDQTLPPWAFPEDCRFLMHNAGVVSKKLAEEYQKVSNKPTANKKELEAIKNLSDISTSLTKTYEVFCKK